MSKMLLNEQPLLVMPQLAVKIGLNESLILQQIHYWNQINEKAKNNLRDGYYWTFNSYEQWQEQFPFWSVKTIQRAINNLEKLKLVVTGNYNKMKIDRTKWYRINYGVLEILETSPFRHIDLTNRTEWLEHLDNMTKAIPETNTKTNSETRHLHDLSELNHDYVFSYINIMNQYGYKQKKLTTKSMDYIRYAIGEFESFDIDLETWEEGVIEHFEELPKGRDGDILLFLKASFRHFEIMLEDK